MHEAEWQTRKMRIDTRLRSLSPAWQIIPRREGLDASALICLAVTEFPTANGPADYALFVNGRFLGINEAKKVTVMPFLLARAWTHSLPACSGCALSLRKILFTRSQRARITGQLFPQDPTDEPASTLLARMRARQIKKP